MSAEGSVPADLPRLGSTFGHYRLDGLVGRGGMGVVFRATDLRLERTVALKFLAPEIAADEAFRERFIRESRLAAAIEHPAIVPIHEAGAIAGILFIAMRFVPGRDLGTVIRMEAPLDPQRTIAIARQVAGALDAAHRRGLVHRDVKPANVLIEQDGEERAYLADFGLTRRLGEPAARGRSGPLGTLDYVAPEQIEQSAVDGRADQYALAGLVLHCLTGSPPFEADTDAGILYAHLHAERPRLGQREPALAVFDEPLARALSRSPDERFADCGAFVTAMHEAAASLPKAAGPGPVGRLPSSARSAVPSRGRRRAAPIGIMAFGTLLVVGVVAAAVTFLPRGTAAPRASPLLAAAPGSQGAARGPELQAGEVIVFASDMDGDFDLYALEPDRPAPRRLTRTTRDERSPAISPDGTTVAYVVGREPRRDIWLMDADGSDQRPLVTHAADDIDPAWSADGRRLAFASSRSDPLLDIFEIRGRGAGLDQRDARNVAERPALEHDPDWAPSGDRVAIASNHYGGNRDILVMDVDDADVLLRRTATLDFDFQPRWSPDGDTIAFYRRSFCRDCANDRGTADLYVTGARAGREQPLTETPSRDEVDPDWSPDGRALVYAAGRTGATEIHAMTVDGGDPRQLTRDRARAVEPVWGRRAETSGS